MEYLFFHKTRNSHSYREANVQTNEQCAKKTVILIDTDEKLAAKRVGIVDNENAYIYSSVRDYNG